MTIVKDQDIGGAVVRRHFKIGGDIAHPGQNLTRVEVLKFPKNNRQSLIDNGLIAVYPPTPAGADMHIISRGFGKFDVIQGNKLNIEPLTREQAEAMIPGQSPEDETN